MTRGDEVLTTPLVVASDPRSTSTLADRHEQWDLSMKLYKLLGDMTYTVERMNGVRANLNRRAQDVGGDAALAARLRAAGARTDSLRRQIVATTEGGAITGEERLREQLTDLYGGVTGWDGKPTRAQVQRAESITRSLDEVSRGFESWLGPTLAQINRDLAAKGLDPVTPLSREEWNQKHPIRAACARPRAARTTISNSTTIDAEPQLAERSPRWAVLGTAVAAALLLCLAGGAGAATSASDSIRYGVRVTDLNLVGITTTNYGFFGNNFISRSPSFEYPLGSGYEHMSRAGLWVGAKATGRTASSPASRPRSSTTRRARTRAPRRSSRRGQLDHRALAHLQQRALLADALSDQDLISSYSDEPGHSAIGINTERHTPLDILVRQRVLVYSLPVADDFIVVQYTIVNQGPPLRDVWVGQYAQLVSGDKNAYSSWPPNTATGPGSWYYHTYVDYDAVMRLYREHYCAVAPYPDECRFSYAPPWAAVKLLRTLPDSVATRTVSLNWWSYAPQDPSRDTDVERYAIMSNGEIMDPTACVPGGMCSPIVLMSVGPFAEVDPGDSVSVDFAFVAGGDLTELNDNAMFAQFASDQRYRLPTPPPSPRVHVVPGRSASTSTGTIRPSRCRLDESGAGWPGLRGLPRLLRRGPAAPDARGTVRRARHDRVQHRTRARAHRSAARDRRRQLPLPPHDREPARRLHVLRRGDELRHR
jgi:hypothetical protein